MILHKLFNVFEFYKEFFVIKEKRFKSHTFRKMLFVVEKKNCFLIFYILAIDLKISFLNFELVHKKEKV